MPSNPIPRQLLAAVILLFVEATALVALAGFFGWGIVSGQVRILATMLALVVFTLAAAAWVVYLGLGLLKLNKASRTPAVFWQLCQISIAFGSFTGQFANQAIGWAILAPSLAVIFLLFSKPVSALLQRDR